MGDSEKVTGSVAVTIPPETKKPKMKQASLFEVLKPKPPPPQKTAVNPQKSQILSPISNNKKRKSTDLHHVNQKGSKTGKNEETITKAKRLKVDDGENEVSSSSEPDAAKHLSAATKENIPEKSTKVVGSLDKFLRITQAREVSTSCTETTVVDLTEENDATEKIEEEPEQELPDSSHDDKGETVDEEKIVEVNDERQGINCPPEERNKTDDEGKEEDLNKSALSEKDEEEESMEVESELDASVVADNDGNKSLDSTTSETNSPRESKTQAKRKTGDGATPISRPPRKAVKSSSKKEEREKERQRLKEEKEKQKQQEREEKQKQKDAAKAERERLKKEEKERKEKERAEQKMAKEKEKQAKLEQAQKEKEEKQKKRQAEIDAKNEEKRKKEEEKKKIEDEKRKAEEEKLAKKKQNEVKFKSFFKQQEKPTAPSPKPEEINSRFIAFQVKENMRMAPAVRLEISLEEKASLDEAMEKQGSYSYLSELNSKQVGRSAKTWPSDDKDVLCVDEEKQSKGTLMKAKLLQFHENYRPAYYGTWRKNSKHITARKPLGQDKELLDYEVESDDEWEEEEPGESLSHSEKEDEKEEGDDDDEDDDGFFVPHGYLSDDEGCEDDEDDITPERLKARQLAKAKAFEAEMKKQTQAMSSLVIGCIWWNPHTSGAQADPNHGKLAEFAVQPLTTTDFPIHVACDEVDSSKSESKSKKVKSDAAKIQPVPDEALPDLARLVHGNHASIQKLIKEFREFWRLKLSGSDSSLSEESPMDVDQKSPDVKNTSSSETPSKEGVISKRQLELKIKSIAVYEKREGSKRGCWYVHKNILEEHKLTDLPVPCEWQWITRPNMTPQPDSTPKSGRKTPTLTGTPTRANIQQFTVKMTPEQLARMMPKPEPKVSAASSTAATTPKRPNIQQFAVKMTPEQLASNMSKVEPQVVKPTPTLPPLNSLPPSDSLHQILFRNSQSNSSTSKMPSVSSIPKVEFDQPDGAIPSTSGTAPKPTSLFQRMMQDASQAHYMKKEADSSCDTKNKSINSNSKDDDCMIVDQEGPSLPLVAPKGQPTLFSMLKK